MKIGRSFTTAIRERIWGPGDTYLVIPINDMQVFEQDGWFDGQQVRVRIEVESVDE